MTVREAKVGAMRQVLVDFSWMFTKGYLGEKLTVDQWATRAVFEVEKAEIEAELRQYEANLLTHVGENYGND